MKFSQTKYLFEGKYSNEIYLRIFQRLIYLITRSHHEEIVQCCSTSFNDEVLN